MAGLLHNWPPARSLYLSLSLSFFSFAQCLPLCLSLSLYVSIYVSLSLYVSIYLSVSLCLCLCLPLCLSLWLPLYLLLCLSLSLSLSLWHSRFPLCCSTSLSLAIYFPSISFVFLFFSPFFFPRRVSPSKWIHLCVRPHVSHAARLCRFVCLLYVVCLTLCLGIWQTDRQTDR